MHEINLADELADVRAQIASLKDREAALRAAILQRRGQVPDGRWSRVEVVERTAQIFDKALLPPDILRDPRYWRTRVSRYVKCVPVQLGGSRPAGPRSGLRPSRSQATY